MGLARLVIVILILTSAGEPPIKVRRVESIHSTTWLPPAGPNYYWMCTWQEKERPWPILRVTFDENNKPSKYDAAIMWGASQRGPNGIIRFVDPGFTYEVDGWKWSVVENGNWVYSRIVKDKDEQSDEDE